MLIASRAEARKCASHVFLYCHCARQPHKVLMTRSRRYWPCTRKFLKGSGECVGIFYPLDAACLPGETQHAGGSAPVSVSGLSSRNCSSWNINPPCVGRCIVIVVFTESQSSSWQDSQTTHNSRNRVRLPTSGCPSTRVDWPRYHLQAKKGSSLALDAWLVSRVARDITCSAGHCDSAMVSSASLCWNCRFITVDSRGNSLLRESCRARSRFSYSHMTPGRW